MKSLKFAAMLAATVAAAAALPAAAQAQDASSGPVVGAGNTLLSLSAEGRSTRKPDLAEFSAGVTSQGKTAGEALTSNSADMNKVIVALKKAGIADKDIQTSGISVNPRYNYRDNQAPTLNGYEASNTVSVKVRDIGKLGKVLDALVASGANQVNGPHFEIDQPDAVYDEARQAALAKAQARAQLYAKALDLRVRRIVSISEGGGGGFRPVPMMAMSARGKAEMDTAVSPGETEVSVSLDVVFELGK